MRVVNTSDFPLRYATDGSIGLDLHALETRQIEPGRIERFDTGLSIELPHGAGAFVLGRSSMNLRGIVALTGTIDRDYRGQISVILANFSGAPYQVERGDRIAQLVIVSAHQVALEPVDELCPTRRGAGGFGSTGR
jgi:dUTP pyrophosphatase